MSDLSFVEQTPEPTANPEAATASAPDNSLQWGSSAPKGGKTVVTRALKDGAKVPLFLGQTLINSLRDLGYNSTTSAVCEHIDNSIEAGAAEVRVYFRQKGKQPNQQIDVLVLDNGKGMAPNLLKVAMAFGGSIRFDNRSGIGRYGMGMKAAALNVARSVDVYSWQEPSAYYSMTLDVEEIGRDRNNMIELPDPQLSDALPSEVASMLTEPMKFPKQVNDQDLLADEFDDLKEALGRSGTIIYMPNCDRLSFSTDRGLVEHATKEIGRIYRRFIEKGVRLYVNNRRVEAFDPTFWMPSARHTKVEGLAETKSSLIDSWTVKVPIAESSKSLVQDVAEVRVRMFLLPIQSWSSLSRDVLKNKLHVYDDHFVSYVRNNREVEIGAEPRLKLKKHHTNAWLRVEIEFTADADEAFGVAANKQGVRLKQYVADAILNHDDNRFTKTITNIRKLINDKQLKATASQQAGQTSEAEQHATEADKVQSFALPVPPTDTKEQLAALEENLRGLSVSLKREGETDEQAFERVKASKYLTDFKHMEYAPFYDTEYRFGKLIVRVNTAHPFYQKVWQPLADLAKKAITTVDGDEEGIGPDLAESTRKALLGLELMILSLGRAQAQMASSNPSEEQTQLFRNLRKAWSDVMETQFMHV
ncbi:MAG TPA: ATP-binding protein [Gemmata sp.]|nr:ATP-binding protein [Gemmata sp.]